MHLALAKRDHGLTMTRIIAAITDDSAAEAVLATSNAIAGLFSASVDALHVREERVASVAGAQAAPGTVAGAVAQKILDAALAEDVAAVTIGARGLPDKRPVGSTAMAVAASSHKPVVVVPPDADLRHPIRSVLVPLDGTAASAGALQQIAELVSGADLNIVVVHVQSDQELPAFGDQLPHEVRAWREEFMARNCPAALDATLELRVGGAHGVHEHILNISRRSGCDLVVLGWGQDVSGGHAAVVREMLARSPVPVLLTPVRSVDIRRTAVPAQRGFAVPSPSGATVMT